MTTTIDKKMVEMGRLAFRVEGENWNAYYALPDTMDGALYLGTIRMAAVKGRQDRKDQFMDVMRESVADILEEVTGTRPSWGSAHTAPEHEKAGRA